VVARSRIPTTLCRQRERATGCQRPPRFSTLSRVYCVLGAVRRGTAPDKGLESLLQRPHCTMGARAYCYPCQAWGQRCAWRCCAWQARPCARLLAQFEKKAGCKPPVAVRRVVHGSGARVQQDGGVHLNLTSAVEVWHVSQFVHNAAMQGSHSRQDVNRTDNRQPRRRREPQSRACAGPRNRHHSSTEQHQDRPTRRPPIALAVVP
jgi:hypothetical protein